jgi:Cu-Zn family superoxide dismutase
MTRLCTIAVVLLVPTLLVSAGDAPKVRTVQVQAQPIKMAGPQKAVCVLHPLGDHKAHGIVVFSVKGNEIQVTGKVEGLTPGEHGFHVHEFGDCSSPDGMSTGGHFNPTKEKHGGPHSPMRHVGDLGNIKADGRGVATINVTDRMIKLSGPNSIIGRALIVHAKADDLKTDPAGDAGGRIACGVIGVAKAGAKPTTK